LQQDRGGRHLTGHFALSMMDFGGDKPRAEEQGNQENTAELGHARET
jgi:hypothetical protein